MIVNNGISPPYGQPQKITRDRFELMDIGMKNLLSVWILKSVVLLPPNVYVHMSSCLIFSSRCVPLLILMILNPYSSSGVSLAHLIVILPNPVCMTCSVQETVLKSLSLEMRFGFI